MEQVSLPNGCRCDRAGDRKFYSGISVQRRAHRRNLFPDDCNFRKDRDALPLSIFKNCLKKPIKGIPKVIRSLGDHIRKKRLESGLFQKEVAVLLHVSEDTVTYWENGRAVPMINHYPRIVSFLGYNPFFNTSESFSDRIIAYRMAKGLSCKKFAKLIGVDAATVSSWQTGRTIPQISTRRKFEGLF